VRVSVRNRITNWQRQGKHEFHSLAPLVDWLQKQKAPYEVKDSGEAHTGKCLAVLRFLRGEDAAHPS
jgi:hypothetical protein